MDTVELLGKIEELLRSAMDKDYSSLDETEVGAISWGAAKAESLLHMFVGKGYFSTEEEEVAAHAKFAPDAKIIFDVGANAGKWSVAALERFPAASVYAFEPSIDHLSTLTDLQKKFGDRFKVVLKGASDRSGTATLFKDVDGSKLASLYDRDLSAYNMSLDKKETVSLTTLDSAAAMFGLERVDIIKIDVEGHEMSVLEGATSILEKASTVQFEFGGTMLDARRFMKDFYTFFTEREFNVGRIAKFGLNPLPVYWVGHEAYDCANYIAHR